MNSVHYSSISNEWQTHLELYNSLNYEFGGFNLDAAATKENALCKNYYTIEEDSLKHDWSKYKSIYCNPPYGRLIGKFVEKAYNESLKGCIVVMLVPSRTDTKWWHNYCVKGEIRFIKGRLKFINRQLPSYKDDLSMKITPAPFPSAIVIFGKNPQTKYIEI